MIECIRKTLRCGTIVIVLASGCGHLTPDNRLTADGFYMPERQLSDDRDDALADHLGDQHRVYRQNRPYHRYSSAVVPPPPSIADRSMPLMPPLSPGDRINLQIVEGDGFNGSYEVNLDGTLQIPYLQPLPVAGLDIQQVEQRLSAALVREGLFRAHFVQTSVRQQLWAPVKVHVTGAVFEPGRVTVNSREADLRGQQLTQNGGDYPLDRTLTAALRAAGGVRPDADLAHVIVSRGHQRWQVDLSGAIDGRGLAELPLAAGDRIEVPTTGRFQTALVRPSEITPPGIRVFMSNLTVPSTSNANSAIGQDATRLPYGTRLLQAMISANCVGGTGPVNSDRYVVLASYNPLTGDSEVIERSVERLIRDASRDEFNPYLLPNDALACYDSGITSVRDVARTVSDVLSSVLLIGAL